MNVAHGHREHWLTWVFEQLREIELCGDPHVRVRIEGGCKDLSDGICGSHDDANQKSRESATADLDASRETRDVDK